MCKQCQSSIFKFSLFESLLHVLCVFVSFNKDKDQDEQKQSKCTSVIEIQHHHLLHCLEKTTVSTLQHFNSLVCGFDDSWKEKKIGLFILN